MRQHRSGGYPLRVGGKNADKAYSIAPGEGQKPLDLFTDEHFEELSNLTKYPYGNGGINAQRKILSIRDYCMWTEGLPKTLSIC